MFGKIHYDKDIGSSSFNVYTPIRLILIKSPLGFFMEFNNLILKYLWKSKDPSIDHTDLKNKVEYLLTRYQNLL